MSVRINPTVSVRLAASARAALLRTKPSSAIAASTLRRVWFGDEGGVVEHIGNGADRDAGTTSDVLNARELRPGSCRHRQGGTEIATGP